MANKMNMDKLAELANKRDLTAGQMLDYINANPDSWEALRMDISRNLDDVHEACQETRGLINDLNNYFDGLRDGRKDK